MLPYTYLIYYETLREEIIDPPELINELTSLGIEATEITIEEFLHAEKFGSKYKALSKYDKIALAIAKERCIPLLTGDFALRKAAKAEGVEVLGTIGILDQLYDGKYIKKSEYKKCLENLRDAQSRRLPVEEINSRLQSLAKDGD